QNQLHVLDISDPNHITELSSFSASGWQTQDGRSLAVLGTITFFGRTVGGFNSSANHELFVLDTTDPRALIQHASTDVGASVHDIFVRSSMLFLATSDSANAFQV